MVAQRSRYYTPNEVALHNTPSDLWVSFLGKVYDLTELVKTNFENDLIAPILAVAGQDISHWFNARTGDIKTHFDAEKVSSILVDQKTNDKTKGHKKILLSAWTLPPRAAIRAPCRLFN